MRGGDQISIGPQDRRPWWETRWFVALLIVLAAVPLLYPRVPPLVDLFGHMGRYRVELDLGTSPWLSQYYGFRWAAIGNLGVDILVLPFARLFGLELGVKLIVLAIPPMTVAGFLWVAREVHGRVPPTALFALPFVYSQPFMYGFVNYVLAIAFAFLAFGLWLHLGRREKLKLRAALFVPISLIVFFTHTYGWGVLGLLCFSAEAVRLHDRGVNWFKSAVYAAAQAAVMILPLFIMLAWREETSGGMIRGWFHWKWKWLYTQQALRDRWEWFDKGALIIAAFTLLLALFHRRLAFSRNLFFSMLVLLVGFLVIPRTIFGSHYADMRLVPFVIAVALLGIRFKDHARPALAQALAVAGLAFYVLRIAGHTFSLGMAADDQNAKLEALNHVPMGARVASMVAQESCDRAWNMPRNSHLGGMVIVRKHGFSNDQWSIQGQNLLQLRYHAPGVYRADPSQMVRAMHCRERTAWRVDYAFSQLPRDKLDYLWMIDPPPIDPKWVEGMEEVWRGKGVDTLSLEPMTALSIVVPCFNEEACIELLHRRLTDAAVKAVGTDYEIVLINDGSRDGSWAMMQALSASDPHLMAINLSRNHGHQLALTAGLDLCRGETILIIDADLQDPPELLAPMLERMRSDEADVVYGVRQSRAGETAFKRATAHGFYRLLSRATEVEIPLDAGDFRLMSRRALDALLAMPEQARFIRGMVAWIGFRQVPFAYDRAERHAGISKYPFGKMVRFALDALTGFSSAPLKLASHAGLLLSAGSLLIVLYIAYAFLTGKSIQGWTSLMLVVVVLGAVQMFVLALMGEYIGRLYNEAKKRPLYIVQDIAGGSAHRARLGYLAEATANRDNPGGKGTRPIK